MKMNRRNFMQSAAVFSAAGIAPQFLATSAQQNAISGFTDDRVLVVVQLGGGNDGLNAVVPHSNDTYYRSRPTIGLKKDRLIRVTDDIALNDQMAGIKGLYDDGKLGIIQGVGYPNPNRSHFRSMEIWETASDSDKFSRYGWIGRYFDNTCSGAAKPEAGLATVSDWPQAFDGAKGYGIATDNPQRFGWEPGKYGNLGSQLEIVNAAMPTTNPTLEFLRHTATNAIESSGEVEEAAKMGKVELKGSRIDRQLSMAAGLIRGGLSTRIYYVSTSGFDTHAGQVAVQDRLLGEFSEAMAEFQAQLERDGTADRVITIVFSEFGRRVKENGSLGTDHGVAGPMFIMGSKVRPGLHGQYPSLDKLEKGDLIHTVDFRSVYATVLEKWFNADSQAILKRQFNTMDLIA